jgi:hypothetical protein
MLYGGKAKRIPPAEIGLNLTQDINSGSKAPAWEPNYWPSSCLATFAPLFRAALSFSHLREEGGYVV